MHKKSIDINVDVGEGIANESQLMPYISSCNIACGGHAGDCNTMKMVVNLAKQYQVKIGAHPSYPDKENFGRKRMTISSEVLYKSLKTQVSNLISILNNEDVQLHHIKPHGALYNLATTNLTIASIIIDLMKSLPPKIKLYVPYKSVIAKLAITNNIPIIYEAFADRNYNEDLTLVSRSHTKALISNSKTLFIHVYNMITQQKVTAINGAEVKIKAETFCFHGDHPKAVALILELIDKLSALNIKIR